MSDLKQALRVLRKSPGFAAVAVLTIALGIGANTTLFSAYDHLILNPVTIPDPSSLVAIWISSPAVNFNAPAMSWPRYEDIGSHTTSFNSIAISAFDNFTLTGNGDPEQLTAQRVSSTFFPTLGVMPAIGRNFTSQEDVPNGPAVCILSHELWNTRFGQRTELLNQTIMLNGQPWQVVGIMPPALTPPFNQVQVFAPRVFEGGGLTPAQVQNGAGYAQTIARLKPGVSLDRAKAELTQLSREYQQRFPARLDADSVAEPHLFVAALVGNLQPTFYTLLGAVGFVLLIACANVASLFLSRLTVRQREIAVRRSLGATRGRIVSQFLVESLVFSAIAAILGMMFALWGVSRVQSIVNAQLALNTRLTLDSRALLFTIGITVLSALMVGLTPALYASRTDFVDGLKDGARGSSSGRARHFRSALIIGEVTLSVILLVGSTLLVLSFLKLQRTPPGFEAKGVAAALVAVPVVRYNTPVRQAQFYNDVIDRLVSQPQVTDAAVTVALRLSGFIPRAPYGVGRRAIVPVPQRPLANLEIDSDGYFALMRIPILAGRGFNAGDRAGSPSVCVVNESFAKRLFPSESPVGKVLLRGPGGNVPSEIVGVIHDVKTNGLNTPPPDEIYFSMRQLTLAGLTVIARTDGDTAALQNVLRSAVAAVDKDQPITRFAPLENTIEQSVGVQRVVSTLTAIFAGLALVLSAVGLYSVIAYVVAQRTAEIGIRMALGAEPFGVIRLVMSGGLRLVVIAIALGLAGAAGTARLIQSLLFQVQALDPLVYGGVAVLFIVVACLACLVPSLRAARIDPLIALRSE